MSIALFCGALCIALYLLIRLYRGGQGLEIIGAYHFFVAHFWPLTGRFAGAVLLGAVSRLYLDTQSVFFGVIFVVISLAYITFFAGSYGHTNGIGVCYFLFIGWGAGLLLTGLET